MKNYARIISLICAVLMLASCFTSCANSEDDGNSTNDSAQTQDAAITNEEDLNYDNEGYWKDDLPEELDYNGEEVTILYWDDVERPEFEIEEDQINGDMIKDAIYIRNITTEERLGITFDWIGIPGDGGDLANFTNAVSNAYEGGTYYDIIAAYSRTAGSLLTNGLIQDLNNIEDNHINLEQPWWPKSLVDTCSIKNSLFFVSGDISTNVLHFMYAIYYNMDMLKNLQLEDPVALVDEKKWTIDALIEYTSDLYLDIDQDGTMSDNDQYGFCSTYFHLDALYTGSDMKLLVPGDDTYLAISEDFFSQKTVDLVDKLGAWFLTGDAYVNPHGGNRSYSITFNAGTCLFRLDRAYVADNIYHNGALRNVEWEYGILPVPLYDENQTDYITVLNNPFSLWCIMQDAEDPSMSSAVIECLASEAYRNTSPMIFENNMKYRYTPDTAGKGDSARMFDIIRESITFDLGRIFSESLSYMSELPSKTAAKSESWATATKMQERLLSTMMRELNKSIDKVLNH